MSKKLGAMPISSWTNSSLTQGRKFESIWTILKSAGLRSVVLPTQVVVKDIRVHHNVYYKYGDSWSRSSNALQPNNQEYFLTRVKIQG